MINENSEQIQKLKNGRKTQLDNWYTKKSVVEKSIRVDKKSGEEIQSNITKTSTKEERTSRSGKNDANKAKVMTRHSDINGQVQSINAKHKNNFKRKMST